MTPTDNFSTLFELLPIGAYRSAPSGEQLRANSALVRLNGYRSEREMLEVVRDIGENWYVQAGRRDEFKATMERFGEVIGFVSEVYRHRTRERIWISENAHVVRDEQGNVIYYEGTVEEITRQRNAELALQRALHRNDALTAKSQSVTVVCDVDGRVSYVTDAIDRLLGVSAAEFIGTNLFDTMHPDDQAEHRAEFARVAEHRNSGEESVARHRHADGNWRYLASLGSDARDDDAVGGMIIYWRDVTETHLARSRLRQLAESDPLTGLQSRANFEMRAFSAIETQRAKGGRIALYYIDLDNFKLANDSYGHWVGDQILIAVARRLQTLCAGQLLLARLGGDEFAVLSIRDEGATSTIQFAQAIVESVCAPIQIDAIRFDVTASVGVALFPEHASRFVELLRFADQAMFAAKGVSRNTFYLFTPELERQSRARAALIADLRRAVEANEFTVFYQPQVDLTSGQLVGVEALVRWQHPKRGLLEPSEFIAVAEEQGLINRIGLAVLDQAVRQIADWRKRTARALRLAINVSARQLRDRSLGARLYDLIEHYGLPPASVEVEVTESILIEASTIGRDLLDELRQLGVRIVLDDLGVGYSSMAYLRRFEVDGVKLDRGFVKGLPNHPVDTAIVRSLISLARELNLTVVAEGVEDTEQQRYLLSERCEVAQGYLFARPLSVDAFEAQGWLKR